MNTEKKGLNIGAKSFLLAIGILLLLMALTYTLTFFVPGGEYARITDDSGNTVLDPDGGFTYVEGGISFVKWIFSPLLVLTAEGNITIIAIIAFLLIIGGIFNSLNMCGLMGYMLDKITHRFGRVKYRLMAVLVFFFMAMGSLVGSFEEVVPMVPIVVALSTALGWDAMTGFGMSILATGCGFAAGVANPFTVGIAQGLAGLPMFSGIWLRFLGFVLIYCLLLLFLRGHARKIEGAESSDGSLKEFSRNPDMDKALLLFATILGSGIVLVLCSSFLTFLQDYTMIIVGIMFLVAGIVSVKRAGMSPRDFGSSFGKGMLSIAPSVLMILMASSIKYIMTESKILDTLLHGCVELARDMPKWELILFIYLICLVMNFFIASGSAKAFLLIPLIVPLAQIFGISAQLCILAFVYGDGFSNVFYPTNPALLISLGLGNESYAAWARYSWKFQAINLLLTSGLLLLGLAVGY